MGQDMHCRLCHNDKIANHHTDRYNTPAVRQRSQCPSKLCSDRHKADIYSGKEQDKPDVGVDQTNKNSYQAVPVHLQRNDLEQAKKQNDRKHRYRDLPHIIRKRMQKCPPQLHRIHGCHNRLCLIYSLRRIEQSEYEHGKNRPDRAQRDQTKAVVCCMLITSCRRDTDTKCHDKRNRHRAGRHTARIKCHRQKILWHEAGHRKHRQITHNQHFRKRNTKQHTQHCCNKKHSDAAGNDQDKHPVRNRRHLLREHLQIRL